MNTILTKYKINKIAYLVLISLLFISCTLLDKNKSENLSDNNVTGGWSLSLTCFPHMGEAIFLKEGEFYYWFYSDFVNKNRPQPKMPIIGKYEIKGDKLLLNTHHDRVPKVLIKTNYDNMKCLISESDYNDWKKSKIAKNTYFLYYCKDFDPSDPHQHSKVKIKDLDEILKKIRKDRKQESEITEPKDQPDSDTSSQ